MIASSTLALIVLCIVILLFLVEKIPMCAVALIGGAAMAAAGIIKPLQAFEGLSSSAVLYLIGMGVVSQALIDAGYIEYIKDLFIKNKNLTEQKMILLFILVFAVVSALFQGIVIMLMIMPVICALEKEMDKKISRKHMYMPLGAAALFGGNLSIIGSSSMLNAVSQVEGYVGVKVGLLAPMWMGIFTILMLLIVYMTFGYRLQQKVFDFPDAPLPPVREPKEDSHPDRSLKKVFPLAVFLGCIVGFVSGLDTGYVSMVAAALLLMTHCIDMLEAFGGVDWPVVFTVTGCVAIGKGVEYSGAGTLIADKIVSLAGPWGSDAYLMCVAMLGISTLLSNFMSNNAAVTITVPIALSIAALLGADPVVYAVACGVGANLSVATPISTTVTAITTSGGYRFRDYAIVGGTINLLAVVAAAAALRLFYF